jgi:hypothetical protein
MFFVQGTKNAALQCLENFNALSWAQELGSLIVILKLRYFDISIPYGFNYTQKATWDTSLLEPLSLDNISLDGITFLKSLKTQAYPSAKHSEVISVSGKSNSLGIFT